MEQILNAIRTYKAREFAADLAACACLILLLVGMMFVGVVIQPEAM